MSETFLDAYIECALWSSTDESREDGGDPLDTNYDESDLAPETLAQMTEDCAAFLAEHSELIGDREERAGHDFWLTRNGHGAGFWDGDWPEEHGRILTDASKVYGEVYLIVGHDEKIHC